MNRREMLTAMGFSAAGMALGMSGCASNANGNSTSSNFVGTRHVYDPRAFGAAGDGQSLDSPAINRAIDAATAAGGGVVYLSPGVYRCGTVQLKSNVTLYLEAGATVLGSAIIEDYNAHLGPPPKGDANDRHLIFARDAENVTLAGPGKIDGQGPTYWYPANRVKPADSWGDVATFDTKVHRRPSPMLEFYNIKKLRIEDVRIENSPGWTLRPMACSNVFIRGITITNPIVGLNVDGIDLTSCQNVSISDCHISTADDAICIKSEDMYGNPVGVTRNVVITNCLLSCCCNGLKFGTSTYGGFENISFTNSVIANEDVPINQRVISGIAIEMVDGGYVDGVTISNIRMQRVRSPIFIHLGQRHSPTTRPPAAAVVRGRSFLRGIMIDNVHAEGSIMTSSITGQPGNPVEDVSLSNIRIETEEAERYPGKTAEATLDRMVPDVPKAYPEARMFGRLPAHGLYARHVKGLRLRGLSFKASEVEPRPAVVIDEVEQLDVHGLRATPTSRGAPLLCLTNVRSALVQGCVAAEGAAALVRVDGEKSDRISISGCDAVAATQLVNKAAEVPEHAVREAANFSG